MEWLPLTDLYQIDQLVEQSFTNTVVVFKHSSRCSISHMAKNRLEREEQPAGLLFYYLDLLNHRSISNKLAEQFAVYHESPQVLLIKNGDCTYSESHNGISMEEILEQAWN